MANNPRKFSEKIALQKQRQAEGTAEFERVMRDIIATKVLTVCFTLLLKGRVLFTSKFVVNQQEKRSKIGRKLQETFQKTSKNNNNYKIYPKIKTNGDVLIIITRFLRLWSSGFGFRFFFLDIFL